MLQLLPGFIINELPDFYTVILLMLNDLYAALASLVNNRKK